jgi:hypothetical protein
VNENELQAEELCGVCVGWLLEATWPASIFRTMWAWSSLLFSVLLELILVFA